MSDTTKTGAPLGRPATRDDVIAWCRAEGVDPMTVCDGPLEIVGGVWTFDEMVRDEYGISQPRIPREHTVVHPPAPELLDWKPEGVWVR